MFSDELKNISWEQTTERIASKTDSDVRRALSKRRCDVDDFMALLSPAAEPYLEIMARLSRKYTHHVDVHTSLYYQLMLKLVCLLRVPSRKPHGANHSHA